MDGARRGERVLYISLSETREELRLVAKRHGWSLNGIDVFELVTAETTLDPERELTVLHPAELELSETTKLVFEEVQKLNATRVVFDSLSELRLLAQSALRYRRQVLALKHFFASDSAPSSCWMTSHRLAMSPAAFDLARRGVAGTAGNRIRSRATPIAHRQDAWIEFTGGYHDFVIRRGGLEVFRG